MSISWILAKDKSSAYFGDGGRDKYTLNLLFGLEDMKLCSSYFSRRNSADKNDVMILRDGRCIDVSFWMFVRLQTGFFI
jgi:hypothetical protein